MLMPICVHRVHDSGMKVVLWELGREDALLRMFVRLESSEQQCVRPRKPDVMIVGGMELCAHKRPIAD